jgi:DNA-binding beta-propeller fold protein YncE
MSISFVILLIIGLGGCQSASNDDSLPHLLTVIEMPSDVGIMTDRSVIHPNGLAYVVNGGGTIAVLDGPRLVKLISWPNELPAATSQDIAVHPNTGWVYVTDYDNDAVHVLSGTEVLATIPDVGHRPSAVAVHPSTGYVYVANARGSPQQKHPGSVAIISGTEVITRLRAGAVPHLIAINPVDGRVYVGQSSGGPAGSWGALAIIDGTRLITMTSLGLEKRAKDLAIDGRTGALYMIQGNYLTYWDEERVEHLKLGANGGRVLNEVTVDEKQSLAYVGAWAKPPDNALIVVREGEVVAEIPVGYDPRQIVVDETHDYVYVANRMEGSLSVIRDTQVITTLSTGGIGPMHLTVDEVRGYIYVSNADTHSVAVFGFND